ncbi:MAG: oxygen-independent coproporphyrinogen III oxidase [Alphaproteobacteria bacterium]|nr:MAG: oxygen-independent coproporphyrinogen III oxidase [Alphaproteobacteria bacterium]
MKTHSQLRRLGLFDARVPRYTSYPTAPHFSDAVGAADAEGWIRAIPAGGSVSVYVHVPFCRRLCWFCACRTQGTATSSPVRAYLETVKKEIALVGAHLPEGVEIEHLHWGGGTPTLLEPDMIADLAAAIFEMAPLAPGARFSVEIDPCEVDQARIDALAAAGMNRASIGVQDFHPEIQETIGRPQGYEITRDAVERLRGAGIDSLNVDILYGLPHQTVERISQSVQLLLSLSPDRVALFGYAHVPWMAKRQTLIPTEALPSPEERLELFETARQLFLWDGYEEIGIDHFARPADSLAVAAREGRMRRNFQGYTEDTSDTLIGLGASAISRYPQGYAQNDAVTSRYQAAVRDGRLATARGHRFEGEDLLRAAIIERLMCDFEADLDALAQANGAEPAQARAMADGIEEAFEGLVHLDGGRLWIERQGRPLARMIARHFDAYEMAASGHSPAI